jgi:PAS domain S-box-containing protein
MKLLRHNQLLRNAILLMGILLIGGGIFMYKSIQALRISTFWVAHTLEVLVQAHEVVSDIKDIQLNLLESSGQSRRIIAGKATDLEGRIKSLRTLTRDNADQQLKIDSLDGYLHQYTTLTRFYVDGLKREQSPRSEFNRSVSKQLEARILYWIGHFQQTEHELLLARKIVNNERILAVDRVLIGLLAGIVALSATIYGSIFFNKRLQQRVLQRNAQLEDSQKEVSAYRHALDESTIVAITDHHGIIKHVNDNFCRISKYTEQELIGKDHRIINSGYHPKEYIGTLWKTIRAGKIWKGELKNKAKDGTPYWVDTTIVPFLDKDGKPYQYFAIRADITDRKKAEAELIRKETRFSTTLDQMMEGVEIIDFDWRYIYVNDAYVKQVNFSREELLGHTIQEKFPGIEATQIFKTIERCFRERISIRLEDSFTFADHSTKWFEMSFQPVPEGVFILSIDVTERNEAKVKMTKSERRFRALVENNYDIISLMDASFNVIYRSPSAYRISGWTNAEMENIPGTKNIHPDDLGYAAEIIKDLMANPGKSINTLFRNLHKDGHYLWMEGTVVNLLHDEDVHAIVFNFRDVTERTNLEKLLHKANTLARIGSWEVDLTKGTIYWSDITREIHETEQDYTPDLENGIQFYKEGPGRDLITRMVKDAIELGKPWDVEVQIVTAKNNERWIRTIGETEFINNKCVRIYGSFQDIDQRKKAAEKIEQSERIYKTIASSIPGTVITLFDSEFRYLLIEGDMLEKAGYTKGTLLGNKAQDVLSTERFAYVKSAYERVFKGESFSMETARQGHDFITHFVPLKNEHNEVYMAMSVGIDVTELKKAHHHISELNVGLEQKIKERTHELELANRELEAFSYSVAHDLRTPLRAVAGYSTILEEDYHDQFDAEGKRLLAELQFNNKKMGDLIDDLLTFSRLGRKPVSKSLIDMKVLITSVLNDMILHSVNVTTGTLHPIVGDAALIKQVMINLISNAVKYSSKRKDPRVEIFSEQKDKKVIYSVRDNGVGFDMKYAAKLFGVFQRLHSEEEFHGTGVGLAIVQRIITRHEGTVSTQAKINEGATFSFSLPDAETESNINITTTNGTN